MNGYQSDWFRNDDVEPTSYENIRGGDTNRDLHLTKWRKRNECL
jgi:hypothetical protein